MRDSSAIVGKVEELTVNTKNESSTSPNISQLDQYLSTNVFDFVVYFGG